MRFGSRFSGLLLVAGLMGVAGCGEDNSPTGGSGNTSVPDHAGANTAITSSNAAGVMTESAVSVNSALGRVIVAAASAKPAAQAAISNVVINGLQSGSITVTSGDFTTSGSTQSLNANIVFDDFSDDGQLYIGGEVALDLDYTLDIANPTNINLNFSQQGDLAFSGKYQGTLSMNINVGISNGVPSVSGSVTVDGTTVNL